MAESKYQFERNLLYASESTDIEIAKTEWYLILKESRKKQDGHCICQRNIKHVIYMYNMKTNHTISVGSKCAKKFGLNSDKYIPLGLRTVLSDFISNASYEIIDDIVEYSDNVEDKVIEFYANKISNTSILLELVHLQIEIQYLITEYRIQYLDNILTTINDKIQIVEHDERVKKEQIAADVKRQKELKDIEELKRKEAEIVEYSDNVEDKVIEFYANKISNTSILLELVHLQIEIQYLITEYRIQYLDNILTTINDKIQTAKRDERVKREQNAADIKRKRELKEAEELRRKEAEIAEDVDEVDDIYTCIEEIKKESIRDDNVDFSDDDVAPIKKEDMVTVKKESIRVDNVVHIKKEDVLSVKKKSIKYTSIKTPQLEASRKKLLDYMTRLH